MSSLFDEVAHGGPEGGPRLGEGYLLHASAMRGLRSLEDASVQTVVTSPPYWGLRDYGYAEQIGSEPELADFLKRLVEVFAEVRRVLKDDGTFWLNIGDGFTSGGRTWRQSDKKLPARGMSYRPDTPPGLKPKDLIGIPWKLAFALQEDGWYLRTDIVWNKPNGNPESVKDRPTRTHEFVFLLTKSERYFYDYDAVKVPTDDGASLKALRSVWNINTEPYKAAHFACFPTKLVQPCVLAGSRPGDVVLDPFFGSGTVGEVARNVGRDFIGIELNDEYVDIARERLAKRSDYILPVTKLP